MAILASENTKIIIQGITGREATTFTKDLLDYGAAVVAGITPGKGGWEVYGVPVFDTVKQAVEAHPADASIISVPPAMVKGAAFEAIDNGIKLVVIVTERVPRRDVVEIVAFARANGARVIGPNSLGLISPHKTKVGMVGGRAEDVKKAYSEGNVGIISRSGGMTTEIANLLTLNGIGQSTCISIGGDAIVGSNYLDLIPLFAEDEQTKAVVIFCEPGGNVEESLAEMVTKENIKLPIVAFVAGRFADEMPGVRFGHAAAIVEGNRGTTKGKIEKFKEAGIMVAEEFKEIITHLKSVL
ncbi:MAG: succinate--CoA ligase subunit alpha [Candidatus Schekmanbacteria bacterium]|nr:MAG: succinate--CoA ligase subunit alpha [Candidatus Schekmanbacteria bacterium]